MAKKKKAILLTLVIIFAILISGGLYLWQKYNQIYVGDIQNKKQDRDPNKYKGVEGISNILLIGVDERKQGDPTHSDALTVLTIDNVHEKLKLTSLMRDALVDIPGHGKQKLTHAYAYGGVELLRKTIEENFNIRLDDYATIDFKGFRELINAVGGVELEVKNKAEVKELNRCIDLEIEDNSNLSKKDAIYIDKPGKQLLNGQQALAFSRMRHVGNGTYDRARRQREVIQQLIAKLPQTSKMKYPAIASKLLPYLKTNVSITNALKYAYTIVDISSKQKNNFEVEKLQIPTDKLSEGLIVSRRVGWVHVMNLEDNKKVLHDFIFENIPYDENKYAQFKYEGERIGKTSSGNDVNIDKNESDRKYQDDIDVKKSINNNYDDENYNKPNHYGPNIKPEPKPQPESEPKTKPESEPKTKPESEPKTKPESEPKTKPESEPKTKPEPQPEPEPKLDPQPAS